MKKLLLAIISITFLYSCNNSNVSFEGKITDGKDLTIYLNKINADGQIFVDSTKTNKKGSFKLKAKIEDAQLFNIKFSNGTTINTIALPDEKIKFKGSASNFAYDYTVSGSNEAKKAKVLTKQLIETKRSIKAIQDAFKNESRSEKDLIEEYKKVINKQRQFSKEFIVNNLSSLAAYMALYQKIDENTYTLNEAQDINFIRAIATSYTRLYPEWQYTKAILANLKMVSNALNQQRIRKAIQNAPNDLPTIKLKNIKNETKQLSDFKGKFIILDFANITSKYAKEINNQYKKIYTKYRNKNLKIYQVALDQDKEALDGHINYYKYPWTIVWEPNSIMGLSAKYWNIKKLPANYLINKNYEIVGKNLFGRDLDEKLEELIK